MNEATFEARLDATLRTLRHGKRVRGAARPAASVASDRPGARRGQPRAAARSFASAATRLVIDLDATGKASTNGMSLDDARLDTLLAGPDRPSDVLVCYSMDTPPKARNAVIGRAQAAGCRVSIARY